MDGTSPFNDIYEKLVRDENDLAGMFGYCFYKEHKRNFCNSVRVDKQREPNQEELCDFYRSTNIPSAVVGYRRRGQELVDAYRQLLMSDAQRTHEISELGRLFDELGNVREEVAQVRTDFNKSLTCRGWISEAGKVVVATVIAAAMVGAIAWGYYLGCEFVSWVELKSGTHAATQAVSAGPPPNRTSAITSTDTRSSMPPTTKDAAPSP